MKIELHRDDMIYLRRAERVGRQVERRTLQAFAALFDDSTDAMTMAILDHRPLPEVDFEAVLLKNAFDAMHAGISEASLNTRPQAKLAAKPPEMRRIPSTLAELMTWYDVVRKRGNAPKRVKVLAHRIKNAYLKKCQSIWDKTAEAFRRGKTFGQDDVRRELQRAAKTTFSRAQMIVATETTNYYNKATIEHYNHTKHVTHYLFVAIGDKVTTPWCKDRDGLVYEAGSELLEKETPAIHWNCRSRVLPLTPTNPTHRKFIEDKTKRREAHRCTPLPPGWGK